MKLPNEVNILGIVYNIEYVEKPSDVDSRGRDSLWGQMDYWTRTIRVYKSERTYEDIWRTLLHEVLHGICGQLHMNELNDDEDTIDRLALALQDVLSRNGWMNL